jgi:hypothetical protein
MTWRPTFPGCSTRCVDPPRNCGHPGGKRTIGRRVAPAREANPVTPVTEHETDMILRLLSTHRRLVLTIAAGAFAVAGCAQIRKVTYPEDFVYLTPGDVSTRMHVIAGHVSAVQSLLDELAGGAEDKGIAGEMIGHIDDMERIAQELGQGKPGTNHLLIDAHIDQFVANLEKTRVSLSATPPRFYDAGKLVGSCNACHRFR